VFARARRVHTRQRANAVPQLVAEPLGRYFLALFTAPDSEERRLLEMADHVYQLRHMDTGGVVNYDDVVALCDRYRLPVPRTSGAPAAHPRPSTAAAADEAQAEVDLSEIASSEALVKRAADSGLVSPDAAAQPAPTVHLFVAESPTPPLPGHVNTANRRSTMENEAAEAGEGTSQTSRNPVTETIVTRFDERQAAEMTSPPPMSTFNDRSVNTYAAQVALAISRKMINATRHSTRSQDMNRAVTEMLERGLAPVHTRLVADKKKWATYIHLKWFSLEPVTEKQVRYHRVLGMGAFGTVNGCIIANIGVVVAVKSMLKKRIKHKKARSQVTAERDALEALAAHPSPYCMRLRYAYESKEAYHLILPLAMGGDLKYHLKDGGFPRDRCRIYAAEVALGLGHLHSLGLVIRDLKPRNILLNGQGHCQISDLGLAVNVGEGRTIRGRAGTEGYWSPEVINGHPYSYDADWWSYGVCLFEFVCGVSPFSCKHTGLKTRNEGTRRGEVRFPGDFDEAAKPLVMGLLNLNVGERLGCRGKGMNEVLAPEFAYWKDVEVGKIRRNELEALWIPERGHIYAASQVEIKENDDEHELRKIKILPEDKIEFESFIDFEDHQRDIVRVLEMQAKANHRLSLASPIFDQSGGQGGAGAGACCSVV